MTTEQILRERAESRGRNREVAKLSGALKQDGVRIRGRWVPTGKLREYSLNFSHSVVVQQLDNKKSEVLARYTMGLMELTARTS